MIVRIDTTTICGTDLHISITTGLVGTNTTPMLLKAPRPGQARRRILRDYQFTFEQALDAYDTFGRAAETEALKVVIKR